MIDPMVLIVTGIGAAFLMILTDRVSRKFSTVVFGGMLLFFIGISGQYLVSFLSGGNTIVSNNAGIAPPVGISFSVGIEEAAILLCVNVLFALGALYLSGRLRTAPITALTLLLMMNVGANGLIMTRDLFNLFVFIEILSIATYAFIALDRDRATLTAGFKYIMAGGLASTFLLLGIILVYRVTGAINVDLLIGHRGELTAGAGFLALFFVAVALLIELKPFPANGWALDVYQSVENGTVALIAVGHTAAVLVGLYKILPLMPAAGVRLVFWAGLATFVFSNFGGLQQRNVKRMLGFSSAAQLGLLAASLAWLVETGAPLHLMLAIAGGLFINHFLAKASLFWLSGIVGKTGLDEWRGLRSSPVLLVTFGAAVLALVGVPPFPAFFAKWYLINNLVAGKMIAAIVILVIGTLAEAAYLLRWFGMAITTGSDTETSVARERFSIRWIPPFIFSQILLIGGLVLCRKFGAVTPLLLAPFAAAVVLYALDMLPAKIKAFLTIAFIGLYGWYLLPHLDRFGFFFGAVFLGGGVVVTLSTLNRTGKTPGFFAMLVLCILSLGALLVAATPLQFLYTWEMMAVSSYLLVIRGKKARLPAWQYIMFSLTGALLLMTGFAVIAPDHAGGTVPFLLSQVMSHASGTGVALLLTGFLIKTAGFGVHLWLPGTYAESDDDVSAFVSAILSKVGIFGILMTLMVFGAGRIGPIDLQTTLSWIGIITAFFGTLMAVFQEDIKYLLAYSSMGQIGLIILAASMMDHIGWVSAQYLVLNHLLFKGMLFLAFAGVVYRTKTRQMYQMGGLIKRMPVSFISVLMAIIALSGVPPLSGFGGKWLLFTGLLDKGWYAQLTLAFFSSSIAFLYCFRLIHTVFLGQAKAPFKTIREAPVWFLLPQIVLIAAVMVFSIQPALFIKPMIAVAGNWYPSTLSWDGGTLISRFGYWNGFRVMMIVMAMFAVLLGWMLFVLRKPQKVKQFNIVFAAERPHLPETTHYAHNFFAHYQKAFGFLVKPRGTAFWEGVGEWSRSISAVLNNLYTGNGQTYAIHILLYVVLLYFIVAGGVR
ncbi:MAG: hypothetical protein JW863_17125 [Chitinispirillaceae bacterium]|nr:hypothetical protein [Chitinispirillaceae bacterium]